MLVYGRCRDCASYRTYLYDYPCCCCKWSGLVADDNWTPKVAEYEVEIVEEAKRIIMAKEAPDVRR
jgi:hypothetical protein